MSRIDLREVVKASKERPAIYEELGFSKDEDAHPLFKMTFYHDEKNERVFHSVGEDPAKVHYGKYGQILSEWWMRDGVPISHPKPAFVSYYEDAKETYRETEGYYSEGVPLKSVTFRNPKVSNCAEGTIARITMHFPGKDDVVTYYPLPGA